MTRTSSLLLLALGCSAHEPAVPAARFTNAPPATIVDDRRDVPKPPHERVGLQDSYAFDVLVRRPIHRSMEVIPHRRAKGVSSIDEVPDSTWFTNRPQLSAEQMRTGPVTIESPELHFPWTVMSNKYGGATVGFLIKDARGVKYQLKLDDAKFPEIMTGADVVSDRLMWAIGYNVPEDTIVYFREQDLQLAPDAAIKDRFGGRQGHLSQHHLDKLLATTARTRDGRYRATASRWLDGKPAGDPGSKGTRKDDPNDRIPHELRRDMRGLFVFYAWIDMVDVWPGNFLDMWIDDPANPSRHYLKHYVLDFDSSLSAMGSTGFDLRRGYTYRLDWPSFWGSLFSVGLVSPDWEHRRAVSIPGVGSLFSAVGFDPPDWHSDLPFLPFQTMDRVDAFWASKILARFTRDQIHAAVEAGRFSDPRAVEYITDTLYARARKTAAYWYRQVNPLDQFSIADQLCFDDLGIAQGFVRRDTVTHYLVTARDANGHAIAAPELVGGTPDGHACTRLPAIAGTGDGYTIFEVTTLRPNFRRTTYVHAAHDGTGGLRIIGIWRA
jgi:hypothetical protein